MGTVYISSSPNYLSHKLHAGIDKISANVLQVGARAIAQSLTKIINMSIVSD
jgi:hypothetical protein